MTRPDPRRPVAMPAAFAGALDLTALKARVTAPPPPPAGDSAGSLAGSGSSEPDPATSGADDPAGRSQYVVEVTEESFGQLIQVSNEILVVVELWASRTDRAAQLSPALEALATTAGGSWILARADIDTNPRIAQAFGVQSVPTVVAIATGQPVDGLTGVLEEAQARQWVTGLLDALRERLPGIAAAEQLAPPIAVPEDPRFTDAESKLDDGDFAGAIAAYQSILDDEPANADAAAALNQTRFLARLADHGPDTVAAADAAGDDVAAQSAAADVEVGQGQVVEGFDRMIGLIRRSAGDDRTAAREHLITLFALFPTDDPQVIAARRRLAAALY